MKLKLIALCGLVSGTAPGVITIGSGPDSSYLILESPNIGLREYEVFYSYDPGDPQDAGDLLLLVQSEDSGVVITLSNFGTTGAPNYFLSTIEFNGVVEAADFTNYWAQWVAGGEAGFPTAAPVPGGSWSYGSGSSAPYRYLAPGSSDAYVFGDGSTPPSIAPIPEPAAVSALVLGSLGGILARRRK